MSLTNINIFVFRITIILPTLIVPSARPLKSIENKQPSSVESVVGIVWSDSCIHDGPVLESIRLRTPGVHVVSTYQTAYT